MLVSFPIFPNAITNVKLSLNLTIASLGKVKYFGLLWTLERLIQILRRLVAF